MSCSTVLCGTVDTLSTSESVWMEEERSSQACNDGCYQTPFLFSSLASWGMAHSTSPDSLDSLTFRTPPRWISVPDHTVLYTSTISLPSRRRPESINLNKISGQFIYEIPGKISAITHGVKCLESFDAQGNPVMRVQSVLVYMCVDT